MYQDSTAPLRDVRYMQFGVLSPEELVSTPDEVVAFCVGDSDSKLWKRA